MPSQKTGGKKTDRKRDLENLGLEVGNKPPQALDVEESVLGALLLDQSSQNLALSELTKNCFYDPRHQMIFEAIQALSAEHSAIDIVTVSDKLRKQGNLEAVGGAVVLSGLSEKVGAASHLEFYIKILKQKAIQRDLISASYDILRDSFDESIDVDDLVDAAQTKVFDAIQSNVRREVQAIGNVIEVVIREIEGQQSQTGLSGVPSGFVSIDRVTQGWQPSDLIIIAARPSVGKTAFALNIARNAAVDHHKPVAFFSLEMSSKQLAKRLMVSETGLSAEKIKGALKLEDYEWQQLDYRIKNL